ncbi:Hypothetical predicted protein [Xyrichtys novacula]|uniref:Uncharacterized protein n=1 Tax=Xyrichtys novacula TaxID=13765 RepID=A0AAV1H1I2_XYRNO|nr:Hypothetical predicted protein [Xyrichtys novacula]
MELQGRQRFELCLHSCWGSNLQLSHPETEETVEDRAWSLSSFLLKQTSYSQDILEMLMNTLNRDTPEVDLHSRLEVQLVQRRNIKTDEKVQTQKIQNQVQFDRPPMRLLSPSSC